MHKSIDKEAEKLYQLQEKDYNKDSTANADKLIKPLSKKNRRNHIEKEDSHHRNKKNKKIYRTKVGSDDLNNKEKEELSQLREKDCSEISATNSALRKCNSQLIECNHIGKKNLQYKNRKKTKINHRKVRSEQHTGSDFNEASRKIHDPINKEEKEVSQLQENYCSEYFDKKTDTLTKPLSLGNEHCAKITAKKIDNFSKPLPQENEKRKLSHTKVGSEQQANSDFNEFSLRTKKMNVSLNNGITHNTKEEHASKKNNAMIFKKSKHKALRIFLQKHIILMNNEKQGWCCIYCDFLFSKKSSDNSICLHVIQEACQHFKSCNSCPGIVRKMALILWSRVHSSSLLEKKQKFLVGASTQSKSKINEIEMISNNESIHSVKDSPCSSKSNVAVEKKLQSSNNNKKRRNIDSDINKSRRKKKQISDNITNTELDKITEGPNPPLKNLKLCSLCSCTPSWFKARECKLLSDGSRSRDSLCKETSADITCLVDVILLMTTEVTGMSFNVLTGKDFKSIVNELVGRKDDFVTLFTDCVRDQWFHKDATALDKKNSNRISAKFWRNFFPAKDINNDAAITSMADFARGGIGFDFVSNKSFVQYVSFIAPGYNLPTAQDLIECW